MLEARFPRIHGDMGNGTTWPFPVLYRVVPGASPEKVVLKGAAGLLPDFIEAAKEQARFEVEKVHAAGKADLEQEAARIKEDLRERVADLAVAGAEKILRREIDAKAHADLLLAIKKDL